MDRRGNRRRGAGGRVTGLSRLTGQFEDDRGVDGHQVVDQALRIDAFGEKARGPGQLDRVEVLAFSHASRARESG